LTTVLIFSIKRLKSAKYNVFNNIVTSQFIFHVHISLKMMCGFTLFEFELFKCPFEYEYSNKYVIRSNTKSNQCQPNQIKSNQSNQMWIYIAHCQKIS